MIEGRYITPTKMLKQLSDKYIKYKVLLIFLASFFRTVAAVGRYIYIYTHNVRK